MRSLYDWMRTVRTGQSNEMLQGQLLISLCFGVNHGFREVIALCDTLQVVKQWLLAVEQRQML